MAPAQDTALTGTFSALSGTFSSALDHSERARTLSRGLLVVGGVCYFLWGLLHRWVAADAVDPLWERAAFTLFTGGAVALSFTAQQRNRLMGLSHVVVFVGVTHYFSLVARNQIAPGYLTGLFVALASISLIFASLRAMLVFSGYATLLAVAVAAISTGATMVARAELAAGVATVQLALAVSTWRNVKLHAAVAELDETKREVRQLRGLLPICMHCRRIRTEEQSWQELQSYVEAHSDAAFTHSLCRECLETHYPE